jgi:nicotinamidase-related amidase
MTTDNNLQHFAEDMPLSKTALDLSSNGQGFGLIIVDEVNGFATVGAGNLAPQVPNEQVSVMVSETNRLAHSFTQQAMPVLAFLDTHDSGKQEPPYPPHCESGTGEEDLVPELKWIEKEPQATLVRKDCTNGFIGAFQQDGSNAVIDWVKDNNVANVLVVGICTDICVMDFVLTLLSARNHGMLPSLKEVVVMTKAALPMTCPEMLLRKLDYHPVPAILKT